jgi:CheY-like chemotaxis protein
MTVQSLLSGLGGRDILQAANGAEALRTMATHGSRIECVVSDLSMTPINGLELLQAVRSGDVDGTDPELPFLLLTGFAHAAAVKAAAQLDVHACLTKPISRGQLGSAVETALTRTIRLKTPDEYAGALTVVEENRRPAPDWVLSIAQSQKREAFLERLRALRRAVVRAAMVHGGCTDELRRPRTVKSTEAAAGMIVAQDIHDPAGRVLLATGTILTPTLISELSLIAKDTGRDVQLVIGEPSVG